MLNEAGETPLHRAVAGGQIPAIDTLMKAGANINVPDAQGKTVLAKASPEIRAYIFEHYPHAK